VKEAFFPQIPVVKEEAAEDVSVCVVSGLELGRCRYHHIKNSYLDKNVVKLSLILPVLIKRSVLMLFLI
jgi:hypothetical protein